MKTRPEPFLASPLASPPGGALPWRLAQADRSLRLFLTAFLLVLTAGYAIGVLFVDHTTSGTPDGLAAEFRGNEDDQAHVQSEGRARDESQVRSESRPQPELKFEKSPREIYTFLHNHIFSLSLLFFCVGTIFYFSSTPQRLKTFLLVEPFVAIVTTFGGIWLTRFVSPVFSWLVIISGLSMLACYVIILFLIIRELWGHR